MTRDQVTEPLVRDLAIEALVAEGERQLVEWEAEREQEWEMATRKLEERKQSKRRVFWAVVERELPAVLMPHVALAEPFETEKLRMDVRVTVEECRPVVCRFTRPEGGSWTWLGDFRIEVPVAVWGGELAEEQEIRYEVHVSTRAETALALARRARVREVELERELEARRSALQEEEQEALQARAAAEMEQLEERERLLGWLEHDPVAMEMLRLLVVIQKNRIPLSELTPW